MAGETAKIGLSAREERVLRDVSESSSAPARQRLRARIVLLAADQASSSQIAAQTGASLPTVALWRRRFIERRLDGLADAPRSGRPRTIDQRDLQRVLETAAEPPPDGQARWSVRRLADATGLPATTVHRIRRERRLVPERAGSTARAGRVVSARADEREPRSQRAEMARARRELIRRSAAAVIAERGFAGTTMALVAREAGVSTGMLNHYFANRSDMLTQTLEAVSNAMFIRVEAQIAQAGPGLERFEALLRAWLPRDPETVETWRVWLAAYGETVSDEHLRETIESRLEPWHALLDSVLSDVAPDHARAVPLSWQLNAFVNGLVIQALAAKPQMTLEEVSRAVFEFVTLELDGARPAS
jgi:AcrR family transcriptional regulator/transposase